MRSVQKQTEEKKRFFANLRRLGESDDDDDDENDDVEEKVDSSKSEVRRRVNQGGRDGVPAGTTVRIPIGNIEPTRPTSSPSSSTITPQLLRSKPEMPRSLSESNKRSLAGKRKAKDEVKLVPEGQRIFNELVFYGGTVFVPNDDIAKPRKLKINRALAHGAARAVTFDEHVTHIVVERHLDFDQVLKSFVEKKLAEEPLLVKDTWMTESIDYKSLRDPQSTRFRVSGAPLRVAKPTKLTRTEEQSRSAGSGGRKRSFSTFVERDEIPVNHTEGHKAPLDEPDKSGKSGKPDELDQLDRMVQELQNIEEAALEIENETDSFVSLPSEVPETSFESEEETDKAQTISKAKFMQRTGGFTCLQPPVKSSTLENPNALTISILQKMAAYYDRTGDNWRTLAYRKGISALKNQSTLISTKAQALSIPQIGERLAEKIEEIVTTHRLRRLDNAISDPNDKILQLFMGIYDVGYRQASLWIAQGYRTLDDLYKNATLTANQRIGIEHCEDFSQRIPREEVAQHGAIVEAALKQIDPKFEAIIGGSYRRGNTASGDIDIIITKPDTDVSEIRDLVTTRLIPALTKSGFLKATLVNSASSASSSPSSSPSSPQTHTRPKAHVTNNAKTTTSKFHGASALPPSNPSPTTNNNGKKENPWRRIDFLYVPTSSLGAALLYFTGNDIFNRSIRQLASKKGMKLNQYGLYKDISTTKGKDRADLNAGVLVEARSEKRIFEILGVPWREPEERNC